jgi:hypothetical protein
MARVFGQGNCLTSDQQEQVGDPPISDTSCYGVYSNTCGIDARELLDLYPVYNPAAGVSLTEWGEINVPWGDADQEWGIAKFDTDFGYRQGDRVIRFEQDADYFVLYEAIDDIERAPGVFDPDEWEKICQIRVTDRSLLYNVSLQYPYWAENQEEAIVRIDTACGDYSCVYESIVEGIPTVSPPNNQYWARLFCVDNGKESKCKKLKSCGPGRVLVSLSEKDNDLICVPVESTEGVGPSR